ncbi:POU domain, class 6, transcription factor 1 isoform X5 [Octodon degus]|uniref:POU domain, class 6, transcription factor 1 isoform X5 n=1 Tax=Octodon degus TaxID=10160 RepID=A0A6P6F2N4_OCTDE|nr:POU domain, class 6, transcription factor 1 isoform X5 [Octodon degus]XP_023578479.1 POU domain, class 6, transcription factor 1 isoform X5 [Octodon degus]XP_023578480.1 POU domain, class 6, transcription factor 1 isoform X5 [Octodon degus]
MRPSGYWKLAWTPSSLLRRRAKDSRVWLLRTPRAGALLTPVNLLVKLVQATQTPLQNQLSVPGIPPGPAPDIATFSQAPSQPQASQTLTPLTVQAAPQVLTQENLATVLTGVMVPAGAVTQPLLIPISIAGQVAGQQGLAVWTIPTATVAALPGLTAASPTGGIFKPPLAGLQAAAVLNTALPAPVQAAPPAQASSPAQPRPPAQPPTLFQTQPLLQTTPAILPQPTATSAAAPTPKPVDTTPQITVQPAGFAFSPGIISAASLGAQTQILGSLTTTPVITSAIPSMPGISSQILTNAQGQVIGTLPWVVNSASVAAPAPAQSLQVQAVTPQLLLNAQGQVIATLASSPLPPPVAVRKPSTPESPAKSEVQPIQPTPAVPQPAVVITSPAPAVKPSASTPIPITCSETPTVSQLVSKPHTPNLDEDGINLEEIREFAKNFKIRRLSLGLTQTQVGQALTATEGPAYSQSAICRFEKLDITPKSAQKLKPVLEKWLNEAELRNQEGQQNLMEFVGEPGPWQLSSTASHVTYQERVYLPLCGSHAEPPPSPACSGVLRFLSHLTVGPCKALSASVATLLRPLSGRGPHICALLHSDQPDLAGVW